MKSLFRLKHEDKGAAALEFALVAPALILFIVGIAQFGVLFMANNGLRNAVGEGARYATIYPRPTNAQISQRLTDGRFGLKPSRITGPTYTPGISGGADYIDITMSYTVTPDFIFFTLPPLTLTETRRAFVHPTPTTT